MGNLQGAGLLVDAQGKVGGSAVQQAKAVGRVATAVDLSNEVGILHGAGDVAVDLESDGVDALDGLGETYEGLVNGEAADGGVLVGGWVRCSSVMSWVDDIDNAVHREDSGGGKAGEDEGCELHFAVVEDFSFFFETSVC